MNSEPQKWVVDLPPGWASIGEYQQYAAQYWAMRRAREGYRAPPGTSQHILYLLLTVFTGGLFLPVWIVLAIMGRRVPGDPRAPMPVWPPPGRIGG